jgi:hypothetical protein
MKNDFINTYFQAFKNLLPDLTVEEFSSYYDEAIYSGYPHEPGGSVWESEGKSIYVFIRCLKPRKILEIGNYLGVSSNHILQAVEKNGFGEVTLLDIHDHLLYDKIHNRNFIRAIDDSRNFLANATLDYDLYIQDACHEYEFVKTELDLILSRSQTNFHIWGHDWFHEGRPEIQVRRAWSEKSNELEFYPCKDSVSDCGCVFGTNKKKI